VIVQALIFFAIAAGFLYIVRLRTRTGSITGSTIPALGSGRTTREKHPVFFWFWNSQFVGAAILSAAIGIVCLTDTIGLTAVFEGLAR